MVYREVYTEGSGTAKPGTDVQELHKRLSGRMSRHITAKSKILETVMTEVVDAAGIGGKKMFLPGEVSPINR